MGWFLNWVIDFLTAKGCYLCKHCRKRHVVIRKGNWGKALLYCRRHGVGVRELEMCREFKRAWMRVVHPGQESGGL